MGLPPHGTRTRYVNHDKCRCAKCRAANTRYMRKLTHGSRRTTSPDEAREHLEKLRQSGIGTRQVTRLTGISRNALMDLRAGKLKFIRVSTANRILGITLEDHVAMRAMKDATETRRQLHELRRLGLREPAIARALGYRSDRLQFNADRVTVKNAKKVETLYRLALRHFGGEAA